MLVWKLTTNSTPTPINPALMLVQYLAIYSELPSIPRITLTIYESRMHGSYVWPGNTRLYIGQMLKIGCYRVQHPFVYCCNITVDVTKTRGARKAQSKVELNGRPVGIWPCTSSAGA